MDETEAASQLRIIAKALFTPSLYLNCRGLFPLAPTFSDNAVTSRIIRAGMVFRITASPRHAALSPARHARARRQRGCGHWGKKGGVLVIIFVSLCWFVFAHGCSASLVCFRSRLFRFAGLRGRALTGGGRSALPRLCLGFVFAHGCSRLRRGLRGRALLRGGRSALPRLCLGSR